MKLETHLLIDDMRNLNADVIARTYEHGIMCLLGLHVTHLYLDHDLADEKTGYDLLKYMFNHAEKDYLVKMPRFIQLVTSNPVGLKNMSNFLTSNGYTTKDGRNFYK